MTQTCELSKTDAAAIEAQLAALSAAWAAGDADAYAACFTDDADYVAYDGSRQRGPRAIAESHRSLFAGFLKGTRLTSLQSTTRALSADVVIVHALGGMLMGSRTTPSKGRLSQTSTILVRTGEGWRISAFQNTRYRPFSQTLLGRLLAWTAPPAPLEAR